MDRIDSLQFWLIFTTAISWIFSLLLWYNNNQANKRLDGVKIHLKRLETKVNQPPKPSRPRIRKCANRVGEPLNDTLV